MSAETRFFGSWGTVNWECHRGNGSVFAELAGTTKDVVPGFGDLLRTGVSGRLK